MSSVKRQAKRIALVEPINWVLLILSLMLLSGATAITWIGLQPATYETAVTKEVQDEVQASLAKQIDSPEIPTLNLNKKNKRQGPEVTVDPNNIGKTNPFVK